MLKRIIGIVMSALVYFTPGLAQHGTQGQGYGKEKWRVTDPFEQKVFIENNEGQFDGKTGDKNKVLYNTRINGVEVYFTASGIVYRHDEYAAIKDEKGEDEDKKVLPKTCTFREEWEGSSSDVTVVAGEEESFYYSYAKSCKHTTIAHAFKKLVYKNLYPDIDVEYTFKGERKGIEYRIIVHPGGDLAKVKLVYPDAKSITQKGDGDIEINSAMGLFTDEAPERTYCEESNSHVEVNYRLEGSKESFSGIKYDHTKTLIIDPFKTNPVFTGYNSGYDVCYDLNGNVYAYGSYNWYQEVKINNAGVIQWIFTAVFPLAGGGIQYGDFAVDEVSGTSYLTSSGDAVILKVSTLGKQQDSTNVSVQMNEIWRMAYNRCEGKIVMGGGGTTGNNQMASLDTTFSTYTPVNVLGTSGGHHDVSLLCIDNTNKDCFFATDQSNIYATWDNIALKVPINTFLPITWDVFDGYNFVEGGANINYVDGTTGHTYAMNGMVASPDWLYLFDGSVVSRVSKSTGAIISTMLVNPTNYNWGGIDVDWCDNLYVADNTNINIYDSALSLTGSIAAGYQVYDLHIMPNNQLCASGKGFVSAYTITTNAMTISKTKTNAGCGVFNGTASAKLQGCGSDSSQYDYLWSNGATTQAISGLSPGTYTVTISSACDFKFTDTVNVYSGNTDGITVTAVQKNVSCFGDSNGSATVIPAGGKPPYSYDWTPNINTTASASNLKPGTYTVTVSDGIGCKVITIAITQPALLYDSIASTNNIPCTGGTGSATVTSKGGTAGYTYSWAPSGGTNATATGLSAGIYTVTVKDSNGCTAVVTDTILEFIKPIPLIAGKDSVCSGSFVTLTASGGVSYLWSNAATTSSITVSVITTTTYTVTVSNGSCTADTNFKISVFPVPAVTISGVVSLCKGQSTTLTASGGASYLWSPGGSTSSSINVTPPSTTTYTVAVSNGPCIKDTTITVNVLPPPVPVIKGKDSICAGGKVTLTASGGSSYLWSNGSTTSSITVNPVTSTTYTVAVSNGPCTADTSVTINVFPDPVIALTGVASLCAGQSTTLTASGGKSYSWSPGGSTNSSINVTPPSTTTYTVAVSNGFCIKDTTITVVVNTPPLVTITASQKICAGYSVTLQASGGGSYLWSNGATTSSITVSPSSTTGYTVVVSNGCLDSASTIVSVSAEVSSLNVCCDTTLAPGDSVVLAATGETNYSWSPSTGLSCVTCPDPTATPGETTTYTVTSTDTSGCLESRIVTVYIEIPCADFFVPNIFTPNNDGINDDFVIRVENPSSYYIVIYDRWGIEMYKSTNPNVYWNGLIMNTQYLVPDGVYYYIIKATCGTNNYIKKGFVHVLGER